MNIRTDISIWLHEEKKRLDNFKDCYLDEIGWETNRMEFLTADQWFQKYKAFSAASQTAQATKSTGG